MVDDQQGQTRIRPAEVLDERTTRVLHVLASHLAAFHEGKRSGHLRFDIEFEEGEIPEDGFWQNVNEKVL